MKRTLKMLALGAVATSATLPLTAMPIGLRTAAWGVSGANVRAAVATLLPESGGNGGIGETLAALADDSVAANIADSSEYEEFREWALDSGARADALASSSTTWLSFAAGSPILVAEPKDGDLAIDEVSVGADGNLEAVFSLDGVNIGASALEQRLKTVFGVEGTTTLSPDDGNTVDDLFSSDNIDFSLTPTGDGRVKATVKPPGDAARSFFMRVKVK